MINTVALSSGKLISDIAIFFFLTYLARVFGTSTFGKYSFAMSVGGLLSVLISLGFNTVMLRDVSRNPASEPRFAGNLILFEGALAVPVCGMLLAVALLLDLGTEGRLILLLIGSYHILSCLSGPFDTRFRIREEMYFSALLLVIEKLVILVLGVGATLLFQDSVVTLSAYPAAALIALLLNAGVTIKRYGLPDFTLDLPLLKTVLISATPFMVLIITGQAIDRAGIILLASLTDDHAVGLYAAPDRLLATVIAVIAMFSAALFPMMARLRMQSIDAVARVFDGALRVFAIVLPPLATLLFLFSTEVVTLLFGAGFAASADILRIMSLSLPLIAVNQISGVFLMANMKHRDLIRFSGATLVALILLGLALIPRFGELGLAYARLLAALVTSILVYRSIARERLHLGATRSALASLFACIVASGMFYSVHGLPIWITGPGTVAALLVAQLALGVIHRNDVAYLRRILVRDR